MPQARRKPQPGWTPGEELQRRLRHFWPQFGKARRNGPLNRCIACPHVSGRRAAPDWPVPGGPCDPSGSVSRLPSRAPCPAAAAPVRARSPDETEAQFYEALQQGDVERLMAAWSGRRRDRPRPPGGLRLVGPAAIRAAFESMFAHGTIDARPESVRRLQTNASAVHSVPERVRLMTPEGPRSAWVVATNVYQKSPQGWRLVVHHASPGTPEEPSEAAAPAPSVLH